MKNYPLPFLCKWLYHVSCIREKVEKCLLYLSALWLVNLLYGPLIQKFVWIKIFPHFFNPKITKNYLTNFISQFILLVIKPCVFFFIWIYMYDPCILQLGLKPKQNLTACSMNSAYKRYQNIKTRICIYYPKLTDLKIICRGRGTLKLSA